MEWREKKTNKRIRKIHSFRKYQMLKHPREAIIFDTKITMEPLCRRQKYDTDVKGKLRAMVGNVHCTELNGCLRTI